MVRTRFAPSPTGTPDSVHLGFVVRALWNYAFAKKNSGQFILRIEDTDQKRSRPDTEQAILATLKKFGIFWNEGPDIGGPFAPYRQSERLKKYQDAASLLVDKGYAYYDFSAVVREKEEIKAAYESEEKIEALKERPAARLEDQSEAKKRADSGEKYVVRAKIPEEKVFEFQDWILKKKIKVLGKYVPDMILLKSDGFPTYHLAVVVDDIDMQITHVFRGQEWIISTPIHLHVYEGLNHPVPEIGHFSVILDPRTGKKFSKRDLTAMFGVNHWLDQGYLPEALLNYLMLLGWAPKDNREIFTLDEFVEHFDQSGVQKANPTFNVQKLDWFNGQYLRQKTDTELLQLIEPFIKLDISKDKIVRILPLIKDRIVKLSDINSLLSGFVSYTLPDPSLFNPGAKLILESIKSVMELSDFSSAESLNASFKAEIEKLGLKTGEYFMAMRIALLSSRSTPPITESAQIIGKDECLSRLNQALKLIN